MPVITSATTQEVENFLETEWTVEDAKHYEGAEWQNIPFIFKATIDGQIAGVVLGKIQSGVVYIEDVIVGLSFRGKGIGKSLLQKTELFGKENHAHKIWGYTGKDWDSVPFYTSLGYQVVGELPNHFNHKDFVIVSKNI